MGAAYGARTKNNGITERYFEKTRNAAERKAIETEIANDITDPTARQKRLDEINSKTYTDSVSSGYFPNYNTFQMYNRNLAVNMNNFYFDSPIITSGHISLGKVSDLTDECMLKDGSIALNDSSMPMLYDTTNKKWNEIAVNGISNSLTTKEALSTSIAYADIYVLKSNSAFIRYPIYRKTGEPDVNLDFQYVASSYTFYFTDRLESKKTITYNFDGNVQGFTFKSKYVEDIKDTSQITLGCQSYSKTHKKPVWWDGAQWADAMGNIIT